MIKIKMIVAKSLWKKYQEECHGCAMNYNSELEKIIINRVSELRQRRIA